MKITFAAIPAYGHVFPIVPLAQAAAAAGHEVAFAASDQFAKRLPVPVFECVPHGMTLHDAETEAAAEIRDPSDPFAFPTAMFGVVMPRHVRPRLLDHWAQHGRPDLVIHEGSNVGAAQAAAEVGVPSVGFHISLAPADFFLSLLDNVAGLDSPLMDSPLLDPTPPTWRLPEPGGPERIPIRSVAWSDAPTNIGQPVDRAGEGRTGNGPRAYLTLGTVAFGAVEILRRSILETAERCSHVLVAAGPEADTSALGTLPDHVHVERYVDQPRVLEEVDVAIHHGGTGTLLGCLAAGVPQVVTPQGADQFMNAARLAEIDLGVVVQNDAEPGAVGAGVDRLLSDLDLRARVQAVRDEIAAMPSPSDVVKTLAERYAR